jgi:hypothetical protein
MSANQAAATAVLYTPYIGDVVPVYDGTNMVPLVFTELTNLNANSAVGNAGPAAIANNSCYDYFVWSNAGTPTLTRGPLWTNTSTRSAGTALTRVKGIYLNAVSITNGPTASRGTYVGSACSNGTATIDYIFGAGASGGTAGSFQLWNMYNRRDTTTTVTDTGASYPYASATVRQARASAGNQVSFIVGLIEDGWWATAGGAFATVAAANAAVAICVGLNSTSSCAFQKGFGQAPTAVSSVLALPSSGGAMPSAGLNIVSANEQSDGTNNNTFDLSSTNSLSVTFKN